VTTVTPLRPSNGLTPRRQETEGKLSQGDRKGYIKLKLQLEHTATQKST